MKIPLGKKFPPASFRRKFSEVKNDFEDQIPQHF